MYVQWCFFIWGSNLENGYTRDKKQERVRGKTTELEDKQNKNTKINNNNNKTIHYCIKRIVRIEQGRGAVWNAIYAHSLASNDKCWRTNCHFPTNWPSFIYFGFFYKGFWAFFLGMNLWIIFKYETNFTLFVFPDKSVWAKRQKISSGDNSLVPYYFQMGMFLGVS